MMLINITNILLMCPEINFLQEHHQQCYQGYASHLLFQVTRRTKADEVKQVCLVDVKDNLIKLPLKYPTI